MRPSILTSCSNRKRLAPDATLRSSHLARGEIGTVAEAWLQRLTSAAATTRADDLYCGRAFRDAKLATDRTQGPLYVVSAGLGLIPAQTRVPSYSLTITGNSEDNILSRISDGTTAAEWWAELAAASPYSRQLKDVIAECEGLVLVALPAAYLAMVLSQLESLQRTELDKIRIFTRASFGSLPPAIQPVTMPYDARFDGVGTLYPGTQGDFAQRALLHFVETILPYESHSTHDQHRAAVTASLHALSAPSIPHRQKLSDRAVIDLIHQHWDAAKGQSSRMLRVLRDDLRVACEQSRFRDLFNAVKAKRARV